MATLKATVKSKLKTGMYIVYIRVVHNRQSSFIRTAWMVNDKGLKGKDIIDPFVIQQTSNLISCYYNKLNQLDSSNWTISEVVTYLTTSKENLSFSDYAREHIVKLIKTGGKPLIMGFSCWVGISVVSLIMQHILGLW